MKYLTILFVGECHVATRLKQPSKVAPKLQRFLDSQNLSPTNVMDGRMNIIAWNDAYCALNGNLTVMSERERNLVWMTFTSPRFRYVKGDQWELHARRIRCFRVLRCGKGERRSRGSNLPTFSRQFSLFRCCILFP
ncbi:MULTISPECIES: MmyB family transcriptional regulator [Paenibacillus]|uniref:MmyB family transcriptional regulator n=1 Tax=Paenibacillus TaxID=44249 RepID=UPI0022A77539|nr:MULTISPECIES: hypothetical protein [Paenibacillus]